MQCQMVVLTTLLSLGAGLFQTSNPLPSGPAPSPSSALLLVLPRPGIPLSFEQTELHFRKLADGTTAPGPRTTGRTFRDSAGRVRLESETRDESNRLISSTTSIIDPASGYRLILLDAEKVAYRPPLPVQGEGRMFFGLAADSDDSSHEWEAKSNEGGVRSIEGVEFAGTQITYTARGERGLSKSTEFWYSAPLKLTGAIEVRGLKEIFTVAIENLRREEPDPTLFSLPSGYRVVDLKFPPLSEAGKFAQPQ
jgi:hypothetical protein